MKEFNKDHTGFTLVELMVVVAIIGVLSAVAVPNFKKFQAKAKTTEAKLQLADLYNAESSFFADFATYGTCLNIMGYDPSPEVMNRFYAVGFFKAGENKIDENASTAGAAEKCFKPAPVALEKTDIAVSTQANYSFAAGKAVGSSKVITKIALTTAVASASTFVANALGAISSGSTSDSWTIDHVKNMKIVEQGY